MQDWYELNHNLFTALNLQKLALVIILTLIIIVATVNMVSALTMMVTDKTREIAILKSMGATSSGVARDVPGASASRSAASARCSASASASRPATSVSAYGYHLDPKVYLIDRLPIDVRPFEVAAGRRHHAGDQLGRDAVPVAERRRRSRRSKACATTKQL